MFKEMIEKLEENHSVERVINCRGREMLTNKRWIDERAVFLPPLIFLCLVGWRRLHNEELTNLYTSSVVKSSQVRSKRMRGRACSM
jgi:hypothetical protein